MLKFWTTGLMDSFTSRCMADRMQAIWSRYSALGTTPIGTQNMLLHMSGLRSAWLRAGTKPRHTSESIYKYLVGLFYLYKIVSVFVARSGKPLRQWEFTIPTRCTEWEFGPYCIFWDPQPFAGFETGSLACFARSYNAVKTGEVWSDSTISFWILVVRSVPKLQTYAAN